jgi:hypothetical protein
MRRGLHHSNEAMTRNRQGEAATIVILVVAVLGLGTWILKPSLFGGASGRAATGTQATTALETANTAQSAAAAASVAQIGEANALAPASPARDFITREVPLALTLLAPPDAKKLLEAERRRVAVMEGQIDEARRLYAAASKESAKLQRERDEALAARRAADLAHERAAAAEHARTVQLMAAGAVAFLFLAGWVYTKIYSVTPATLGAIAADMRAGAKPLDTLDILLAPRLHGRVWKAAKLAAKIAD